MGVIGGGSVGGNSSNNSCSSAGSSKKREDLTSLGSDDSGKLVRKHFPVRQLSHTHIVFVVTSI